MHSVDARWSLTHTWRVHEVLPQLRLSPLRHSYSTVFPHTLGYERGILADWRVKDRRTGKLPFPVLRTT